MGMPVEWMTQRGSSFGEGDGPPIMYPEKERERKRGKNGVPTNRKQTEKRKTTYTLRKAGTV